MTPKKTHPMTEKNLKVQNLHKYQLSLNHQGACFAFQLQIYNLINNFKYQENLSYNWKNVGNTDLEYSVSVGLPKHFS